MPNGLELSCRASGIHLPSGLHAAAGPVSFSESLCEKSGRWGLVPLRLRGFSVKWGWFILWARGKGCGWERDS